MSGLSRRYVCRHSGGEACCSVVVGRWTDKSLLTAGDRRRIGEAWGVGGSTMAKGSGKGSQDSGYEKVSIKKGNTILRV